MRHWLQLPGTIELPSNLPENEIMCRLMLAIKPLRPHALFTPFILDGAFHGIVSGNRFDMKREEWMNHVAVNGQVYSMAEGSIIEITLTPSLFSAPYIISIFLLIVVATTVSVQGIAGGLMLCAVGFWIIKKWDYLPCALPWRLARWIMKKTQSDNSFMPCSTSK